MAEIHKRMFEAHRKMSEEIVQRKLEKAKQLAAEGNVKGASAEYAEALNLGIYAEEFPLGDVARELIWGGLIEY